MSDGEYIGTAVIAAPGANIKTGRAKVQLLVVAGTSTTENCWVKIRNGAGGATLFQTCAHYNGVAFAVKFPRGLVCPTALAIESQNANTSVCYQ